MRAASQVRKLDMNPVSTRRWAVRVVEFPTGRGELVSVLIPPATTHRTGRKTIDDVLEQARGGLSRLTSAQAREAWRSGAVVVDIRPAGQRAEGGVEFLRRRRRSAGR